MSDTQMLISGGFLITALLLIWCIWLLRRAARQHELEKNAATEKLEHDEETARLKEQMLVTRIAEMQEAKQRQLSESLRDAIGLGYGRIGDSVGLALKNTTDTLNQRFAELSRVAEERLDMISGRVDERLNKGFENTQKTFANVLERLAVIDKAQERITQLSENVVSLQDVLTDKRARGAFGEIQLHQLIRQALPESAYALQATLSNSKRVDCLLKLPDPVGNMAIDAKFPLENYQRSLDRDSDEASRKQAATRFVQDVRKHIADIGSKYIIPGETADGAIMFLPSEAVFAELHGHYPELVSEAHRQRVWIASPTTMMAILTTVAAALKDAETRQQLHIIQKHLSELGKDFSRFSKRFDNLASHIRQANKDTEEIHISAKKISSKFEKIERVDLDHDGMQPITPPEPPDNE